jgi:hypothetical protein
MTSAADTTPPVLSTLTLAPSAVDVSGGAKVVTVVATITDDLVGVAAGTQCPSFSSSPVQIRFRSPSGGQFQIGMAVQSGEAVYSFQVTVPQHSEPGTWTIQSLSLVDCLGNRRSRDAADLASAGFPTSFQVMTSAASSMALTSASTLAVASAGQPFWFAWTASGGTGNAMIVSASSWLIVHCDTADIAGANACTTRSGPGTYGRSVTAAPNTGAERTGTITITGLDGGNTVSVTVTQAADPVPLQPSGLVATSAGFTQVRLNWAAAGGATGYKVKRGTVSGHETLLSAGVTGTSYVDATVTKGTRYFYVVSAVNGGGESADSAEVSVILPNTLTVGDFDGDGKADITVLRPSTGTWYSLESSTDSTTYLDYRWGVSTDVPVPGDYEGDGKTDIAVYRPTTGTWYILESSSSFTTYLTYQWGVSTDVPVPGDYDGDGKTDIAVYRPDTGTWWVLQSSTDFTTYVAYQWGVSTDLPVPSDYDGDDKTDIAVYRPDTGTWWVLESSTDSTTYLDYRWGVSTDLPVPGDYDGDGRTDIAVFRPTTGTWYILQSSTSFTTYLAYQWGVSTDVPVPGDYDGDGKTDIAVYRPDTGTWWVIENFTAYLAYQWGVSTDIPVAATPPIFKQ